MAWKSLTPDLIQKSFHVCGQVKNVDIDEITWLKEGRSLCESKSALQDLMKLSPDEIDYEQLKRKEESENHFHVDCIEEDRAEEHCNEIVIDDLLGHLEEGIVIILQQ